MYTSIGVPIIHLCVYTPICPPAYLSVSFSSYLLAAFPSIIYQAIFLSTIYLLRGETGKSEKPSYQ